MAEALPVIAEGGSLEWVDGRPYLMQVSGLLARLVELAERELGNHPDEPDLKALADELQMVKGVQEQIANLSRAWTLATEVTPAGAGLDGALPADAGSRRAEAEQLLERVVEYLGHAA